MESIFRQTEIEWDGKKYSFTPTMKLLSSIERQGLSLIAIAANRASGNAQFVLMSEVLGIIFRYAGADVSDDEIYQQVVSSNAREAFGLWDGIFAMISPAKKERAPEKP